MKELIDVVRAGRVQELPGRLKPLTRDERKELLVQLKTLRLELRDSSWRQWRERTLAASGLLVAGAGCHTGVAAAAAWIGARELRLSPTITQPKVRAALLDVLADREPDWLGRLAHRLAARSSTAEEDYHLVRELVVRSGCPVPTTDGYLRGWVNSLSSRGDMRKRLHEDPHAPAMVAGLFELTAFPQELTWYSDPDDPSHWPTVLTGLIGHGVVARSLLVDGTVARLLRGGGRPTDARFFLALLERLALTPDERAERVPDWLGMVSDGTTQVTVYAQGVLAELAEDDRLSTSALAELSSTVFFRPEKKLARTHLTVLGKVLRRRSKDTAAVRELLPLAADGFAHEDPVVQERALKLVVRYLPSADDGLREVLAEAAALLGPAHREAARAAFGSLLPVEDAAVYEEFLPAVPGRRELAPATDSVAELVEDFMVGLRRRDETVMVDFERTLDGLVRLAHSDREPLTKALREALADRGWTDPEHFRGSHLHHRFARDPNSLGVVAATLLEALPDDVIRKTRTHAVPSDLCQYSGLTAINSARVWEVAHHVRNAPLPFLLATPTWDTGALDPDDLIARLREYHRLGATPAAADFAQALLRVVRDGGGRAAEAAAGLGTAEGDRLAAWLCGEGPELAALQEGGAATPPVGTAIGLLGHPARTARLLLDRNRERRTVQRDFPAAFRWLGQRPNPRHNHGYSCVSPQTTWQAVVPHWPAVLPHDRERLAEWLLPGLLLSAEAGAYGWEMPAASWCLPRLAEGEGPGSPAGAELHRALAAGVGARTVSDRLLAVDALLVLAARGQLDGALLGRRLAELVQHGPVKINRFTDAARTASATGAYRTVWSVLAAALPQLVRARPLPRGLGGILAVAADCVEQCGPATTDPASNPASGPATTSAEPRAADAVEMAAGLDTPRTTAPAERPVPGGTARTADPAGQGDAVDTTRTAGAESVVDGVAEAIPGLGELAGRGGSAQVVVQAARLLAALREGVDSSRPETVKK